MITPHERLNLIRAITSLIVLDGLPDGHSLDVSAYRGASFMLSSVEDVEAWGEHLGIEVHKRENLPGQTRHSAEFELVGQNVDVWHLVSEVES